MPLLKRSRSSQQLKVAQQVAISKAGVISLEILSSEDESQDYQEEASFGEEPAAVPGALARGQRPSRTSMQQGQPLPQRRSAASQSRLYGSTPGSAFKVDRRWPGVKAPCVRSLMRPPSFPASLEALSSHGTLAHAVPPAQL